MGRIRFSRFVSLKGAIGALLLAVGVSTSTVLTFASSAPASTVQAAGISPGNITSLSDATLATTMQGIASSGATWVRLGVDWPVAEWTEGTFNWAPSDRVAKAAIAVGLRVEFVVNGSGQDVAGGASNVPPWAQTCSGGCPDPSDFGSFTTAVAQHYSPMGIHTYEIWNEPNLASNWGPQVSPSGYTALLIQAYNAIKAVDPQSIVMSGGLSPAGNASDGSQMSPQTFLTDMYADGAGGHMDAVAVHPYCFPADPVDASTASWNLFYNLPNWIYQVMVAHGDGAKQVWLTEFGVPTGTDVAGGAVSEQTQAQQITDAFNAVKQWAWAGPIFYYNWQDGTDPTSIYDNFGLVTSTFAPKPALSAFSAGAALLTGGSSTGTTPAPSVPAAPTNLVASVSGSTVSLSWSNPSGAQSVNVYRDGSKVSSPGLVTSFQDANVASGSHTYYVTASNSSGQGPGSKSVSATVSAAPAPTPTPSPSPSPGSGSSGGSGSGSSSGTGSSGTSLPAAPTNLVASVSGSTVSLSWSNPSGAQGVSLYRDGTKMSSPGLVTSFQDANVASGSHTYYVTASNSSGQGPGSKSVTVTVSSVKVVLRHFGAVVVFRG